MMEEQVAKVDKKIGTPLWTESSQQTETYCGQVDPLQNEF